MTATAKKLVIIVPPGRYRELLASLTLPVAVVRLCNWVQRARPETECHVIEGTVAYGQPVTEAGERKVFAQLFAQLDGLVDDRTLVGFTTFANRDVVHALPLAREVKRRYGVPVVLGGYAASTCARHVAATWPDLFDGVVESAGEEAVIALLDGMDGPKLGDLSKVPNLVYFDGTEVRANPKRPAPRLEACPPLDLSPLYHPESYELLPYFASAGCAFECDFCFESKIYPGYDKNQVDNVVRDIDLALFDGPMRARHVSFVDPLFGADRKRAIPLMDAMRERGLRYTFYTRADVLDDSLFPRMAGHCGLMFLGFEGASVESLEYMNKTGRPDRYLANMFHTVERCFAHGITPQIGVMPDYPMNTRRDVDAILPVLDQLEVLHDRTDANGPGFLMTVFNYHIWYGSPHHEQLADLESKGLEWRPGFADTHHGEPVSLELRRDVIRPSPEYSPEDVQVDRGRLYGAARMTPLANDHLKNYVVGYSNSREGRHVRVDGKPMRWTDDDRDVIDLRGMFEERLADGGYT